MYCGYCGWDYVTITCDICNLIISVCDFARTVCEEHFCVDCGEPYSELNDEGVCHDCESEYEQND